MSNLMLADGEWVWYDFEDTCSGPVAWDLAATTASPRLDRSRILAAYGDPVDGAQLDTCQQLRRLNLTIWYALYAERLSECRQRATELLATWRSLSPAWRTSRSHWPPATGILCAAAGGSRWPPSAAGDREDT